MVSRDYFKGKRIAVIGLGFNGEMVEDVKFLIKAGALVSIYDLKSEARLKNHLVFLRSIGLANHVCGSIPGEDLIDMDLILLSHEYDRQASFLKQVYAFNNNIPVEYPETLFFKQAPPVTVVGIIGEYGKTSLLSMLCPLFNFMCKSDSLQNYFVIDPESDNGILTHLKKIRSGDIVIIKMSKNLGKELFNIRISPHVAIFTSLPGQDFYNKSPFEILSYQTYNNFIVASNEIIDMTHSLNIQPKAKMLRTQMTIIPTDNDLINKLRKHEQINLALSLQIANLFKLDIYTALDILSTWKAPKGRLEFIKKIKNVEFYNDSASVSPKSTELALELLSKDKNVVLIIGGAKTESIYSSLYVKLAEYVHTIILLPGSGTMIERKMINKIVGINIVSVPTIEEAVRVSLEVSKKGDIVLFSPAFEIGGYFNTRKDRGEKFVGLIRKL